MTGDWRDALRNLDLPDGPEIPPAEESSQRSARKPKIVVSFERKGRGGKQATILSGFDCDERELEETASQLKRRLACGGSARGGEILLQGDRRESVHALLREIGYTTN